MPTRFDLLYVATFALVLPLWDTLRWPALWRMLQADPQARTRLWTSATIWPWLIVAVGAALWIANDRAWTSFGFSMPHGWRLWTSIAMCLLAAAYYAWGIASVARSADAQANIRLQAGKLTPLMPHTRADLVRWSGVSLSAGFCEEFLFRGYFIWVFAPWLGWWGAAALSTVFFAAGHAYQGWNGVLRTGIFGAGYAIVVGMFDSLWPAIVLHVLVDLAAGVATWLALREGRAGVRSEIDAA